MAAVAISVRRGRGGGSSTRRRQSRPSLRDSLARGPVGLALPAPERSTAELGNRTSRRTARGRQIQTAAWTWPQGRRARDRVRLRTRGRTRPPRVRPRSARPAHPGRHHRRGHRERPRGPRAVSKASAKKAARSTTRRRPPQTATARVNGLPVVSGAQLVRALERLGCETVRQRGSPRPSPTPRAPQPPGRPSPPRAQARNAAQHPSRRQPHRRRAARQPLRRVTIPVDALREAGSKPATTFAS